MYYVINQSYLNYPHYLRVNIISSQHDVLVSAFGYDEFFLPRDFLSLESEFINKLESNLRVYMNNIVLPKGLYKSHLLIKIISLFYLQEKCLDKVKNLKFISYFKLMCY